MLLAVVALFICTGSSHLAASYEIGDCGLRYGVNSFVATISNGIETKHSEYPWHVALYKVGNGSIPEYICGGSIIQSRAVLTAAHCIYDEVAGGVVESDIFVATGKFNSSWLHMDKYERRFKAIGKKIQGTYQGGDTRYSEDIAILVLNDTIKFSDLVMPICVDWTLKYDLASTTNKTGLIVGWGYTEKGTVSEILLGARLQYFNFTSCRDEASEGFSSNYVTPDKFCAGGIEEGNVEKGDSGGGLIFPRNTSRSSEQYFIYGILSAKDTTEDANIATFTNITRHMAWVNVTLRNIIAEIKVAEVCGKRYEVNYTDSDGNVTHTYRDHPWLATVYLERKDKFFGIRCIGNIIHPNAIITSAWCVDQMPRLYGSVRLKVVVGKHEMNMAIEEQYEQRFNVSKELIHDLYVRSDKRAEHEVAILVVDEEIRFNNAVLPICIDWDHKWNLLASQSAGKIVSWNLKDTNLQAEATYEYLDYDECGRQFNQSSSIYVTSDKDCGKFVNGTRFPFNSDVGGGLVLNNGTRESDHYLYGIVCNGRPEKDEFVTFTSIDRNLGWIRSTLESIFWSN